MKAWYISQHQYMFDRLTISYIVYNGKQFDLKTGVKNHSESAFFLEMSAYKPSHFKSKKIKEMAV